MFSVSLRAVTEHRQGLHWRMQLSALSLMVCHYRWLGLSMGL